MNYSINKKYTFGSMVIALAIVFIVSISGSNSAHACSYGGCYDGGYYDNYPQSYSPLQLSCYPQPLSANVGDSVSWISNVFGGSGAYSYTWSGTDGLYGSGPSLSKAYNYSGSKSATLTVTSAGQTKSISCSGSVNVYGNNYNNYPPPVYNPPVYPPPTYYQPIQVSCTPNSTYTNVGTTVTWSASVYGGNYNNYYGNYSYTWSGSDGLYGSGQSASMTYTNPGYKTATVTVYGNGQTVTQSCSNSVNVSGYNYSYPTTYTYPSTYNYPNNYYTTTYQNPVVSSNNNTGLDIGCIADPNNASINQPITWSVEVTGGVGPYTYSWSGSDGLSGKSDSVIKYYNSSGEKSAVVSVSSADGKTGTRACTNTVTVRGAVRTSSGTTVTPAPPKTNVDTNVNTNNSQSAAALFSLQNIPWGWVALLIILILFATVMYLIFNRPKI